MIQDMGSNCTQKRNMTNEIHHILLPRMEPIDAIAPVTPRKTFFICEEAEAKLFTVSVTVEGGLG